MPRAVWKTCSGLGGGRGGGDESCPTPPSLSPSGSSETSMVMWSFFSSSREYVECVWEFGERRRIGAGWG